MTRVSTGKYYARPKPYNGKLDAEDMIALAVWARREDKYYYAAPVSPMHTGGSCLGLEVRP